MSSPEIKLLGPRNGAGPNDGWMRQFLRAEAAKQAAMVVRVRERVERDLDDKPDGIPSEATLRAARFAQEGYRHLATLELEHAKVELLARRLLGKTPMSDEEYAVQLQALGQDAVRALTPEQFEAEMERRRSLPEPAPEP